MITYHTLKKAAFTGLAALMLTSGVSGCKKPAHPVAVQKAKPTYSQDPAPSQGGSYANGARPSRSTKFESKVEPRVEPQVIPLEEKAFNLDCSKKVYSALEAHVKDGASKDLFRQVYELGRKGTQRVTGDISYAINTLSNVVVCSDKNQFYCDTVGINMTGKIGKEDITNAVLTYEIRMDSSVDITKLILKDNTKVYFNSELHSEKDSLDLAKVILGKIVAERKDYFDICNGKLEADVEFVKADMLGKELPAEKFPEDLPPELLLPEKISEK